MNSRQQAAAQIRASHPTIDCLRNITLTPLTDRSNKRSLHFGADPATAPIDHLRWRSSNAASIHDLTEAQRSITEVIERPVIYGGPMFIHFGHFIAESIHRIWPRLVFDDMHEMTVAFHVFPGHEHSRKSFMSEIFAMLGLPTSAILPIDRPMTFATLFIPPQGRMMAGPSISTLYRNLFTNDSPPRSKTKRLYFSRIKHHHTGSFYGETYIHHLMEKSGFEIVIPEDHSLTEAVELLRESEIAIFAEGSALHMLELCGIDVPRVMVIGRRLGTTRRFTPLLSDVADAWSISEHITTTSGLSQHENRHSSFVDLESIHHDIASFAQVPLPAFSKERAAHSIKKDVLAHLGDGRIFQQNESLSDIRNRIDKFIEISEHHIHI